VGRKAAGLLEIAGLPQTGASVFNGGVMVARQKSRLGLALVLVALSVPVVALGATQVHQMIVNDPGQDVEAYDVGWTVPAEGRLRVILSNPDASRDGHFDFGIEEGGSYRMWLSLDTCCHSSFQGMYWGTACEGSIGLVANELAVAVPPGPIVIRLSYRAVSGPDYTGPDTLTILFEEDPISTADAAAVATFAVGAQEETSFETTVTGPGEILVDVIDAGADIDHGGSLFLYLDGVAVSATSMRGGWKEGNPFVEPHLLAIPIPEGSTVFKISHEDSLWGDNVGNREATVYFTGGFDSPVENDVVFMSDRSGNWDIWRMKPDGSDLVRLTFELDREEHPHWSADGSQIAYTNTSDGVHVMNADGSGDQLVPNTAGDCLVKDWGPCDKIFYTNGAGEVMEISPDGTGKRMLNDGNDGNYPHGGWSPDCTEFVWGEGTPGSGGSANIQISPVSHFDPRQVLPPTTSPVEWSPGGDWILYHQDAGFSKVRPDGTGAEVILPGLHTEYASFLADNDSFIYSDHDDLWASDLAGAAPVQLTSGTVIDTHPDVLKLGGPNGAPTADAGSDQEVDQGDLVQLNGTGSSDPDFDPLSYSWSFVTKPSASIASLSGASSATPTFVADEEGTYTLELEVTDGRGGSDTDEVAVNAGGLVAYWRFDEGSGATAYDSSGNGNDGVVHEPHGWTDRSITRCHLTGTMTTWRFRTVPN